MGPPGLIELEADEEDPPLGPDAVEEPMSSSALMGRAGFTIDNRVFVLLSGLL